MATYTTRNGVTRVQIRMRGQHASGSFDTRTEAEGWADRLEERIKRGEIINQDELGENPSIIALINKYVEEVSPSKKGHRWERYAAKRLAKTDIFKKRCSAFSNIDVQAWRDSMLKRVQAPTFLRDLGFLSSVIAHAIKEWHIPMKANPCSLIRRPEGNPHRSRRVDINEPGLWNEALDWDGESRPETAKQWAAWGAAFLLETAMRKGELIAVKRSNVHKAQRFIHLPDTKNGSARDVPLSKRAVALLDMLGDDFGGGADDRLIPLHYEYFSMLFRDACKKAEIENLHLHDLRHEATTRIAKKLQPKGAATDISLLRLGTITGHKSLNMLRIYFNASASEMAEFLD